MLLTKLKFATAMLAAAAVLGAGAAALAQQLLADQPAAEQRTQADKPADQPVTEKKEGEKPRLVVGIVKSVDAVQNTLTVAHREGETTFNVAQDAKISIDSKAGELAGLPVGAHVILNQFDEAGAVGAIGAQGAAVFGSVKAVDAANNTLTVAGGQADDKTFRVSPDTLIMIDGKPGALAGIPVGASLHALNLCVDQQTAFSINVEGPSFHHLPVKAVDGEKNTITFEEKAPGDLAGKTLPVAADADIRIDGQPGKLSGVPVGTIVNLVLSVDRQVVRRLDVQGPHLGGCGGSPVSAVDAQGHTITFDGAAPAEVAGKTFPVAKDANILIDGKPGRLSGLPRGSHVNVILSVDQSIVRHLHAQGPPVSGIVKAVDADKNIITVDDKTFIVAKDAYVFVDAQAANLAIVPTGAFAGLVLSVDQITVRAIHVKTP